ncbi:MAG: prenyltransferase/squalene oxidase repeat-containing protein [Thermogutta sp.]
MSRAAGERELREAWDQLAHELFTLRNSRCHWRGELAPSPLATATAISALSVRLRDTETAIGQSERQAIRDSVVRGTTYLLSCQNHDGGWGDTDRSRSNIATAYLAQAALVLAKQSIPEASASDRAISAAEAYIRRHGGTDGLQARYGSDKTFVAPIATNLALAGLIDWHQVPALPFELAAFPQGLYRFLRLPVVSYAIPALVAVGQVQFHFVPTGVSPWRMARRLVRDATLGVVRKMQPESGGFLEAVPLTAFVVMSLCGMGRAQDEIVARGVEFLLRLQRTDGAWPVDSDLAVWTTTLAANALHVSGVAHLSRLVSLEWLLACQHRERHPFTGAAPGGWAWTDLPGGVPDADDTSGALLSLAAMWNEVLPDQRAAVHRAARQAVRWLLDLQNGDGGWPTFCRGWGRLPFDRSGVDLTAHAVRALIAWKKLLPEGGTSASCEGPVRGMAMRRMFHLMERAIERGLNFLRKRQRSDGSWLPLWFGNEWAENEENPIYGTARIVLAFTAAGRKTDPCVLRAEDWLKRRQRPDGTWHAFAEHPVFDEQEGVPPCAGIEETALALSALSELCDGPGKSPAYSRGLAALATAVREGRHRVASPIGLYFARLWYYERMYPIIFALEAVGRALRRQGTPPPNLNSYWCGDATA